MAVGIFTGVVRRAGGRGLGGERGADQVLPASWPQLVAAVPDCSGTVAVTVTFLAWCTGSVS